MKQTVVRFTMEAKLALRVSETRAGTWLGVCDPLGISLEADTFADLLGMFNEGLSLLVVDLLEDGELAEFLTKKGWTPNVPVHQIASSSPAFDIPFEVMREGVHA